jgi:hypothetical protein
MVGGLKNNDLETIRKKAFPSSLSVQTSSEAHPASYPMGTGGPSRW